MTLGEYSKFEVSPKYVHCDSQLVIRRAHNAIYNSKSRHIHRKYNIIKQLLSLEIILTT